jgi:glucarate dehydratase
MLTHRRDWLKLVAGGLLAAPITDRLFGAEPARKIPPLKITALKVTPVALPDPPLLASSGCHGPYFLRNIVQIETDANLVGVGETHGGQRNTDALEKARDVVVGQNAFAYRAFAKQVLALTPAAYAGIELACLDACGKATNRRLCELLGGPVREEVEMAAYLFYRYAAEHPKLLADRRIVDDRGKGDKALDDWGEVRTPEAMVKEAERFRARWGFRVFKLKGGVLPPDVELETMQMLHDHFGGKAPLRIDPNARWKMDTALRVGKKLPPSLEYYEDPVAGQEAMAEVRKATGLKTSTNMCVTRFEHLPEATRLKPVDVVLSDHHTWGGLVACQELGRICETFGMSVGQHSNNHAGVTLAAMANLAAVVPQLTFATDTHHPWLPDGADILQGQPLVIKDGKLKLPEGPGLGVVLDPDRLARAHEVYGKCGMKQRDDATTMKLVEPDWDAKKLY